MIHFDIDERYVDENVVGSALSRREGVLMSIVGHALIVVLLLTAPTLTLFQPDPAEVERRQQELMRQQQEQERNRTMVFVQPKLDMPSLQPPERAELSDIDRRGQAPEVAPNPTNPLPYMRGNSAERNEASEAEAPRGPESEQPLQPEPEASEARIVPPANEGIILPQNRPQTPASGALGEALRNLERYVQNQTFDNPQGGQRDPGATIQFDTKGVEFGPWLRRFVSRVRRNWFIAL